MKYLCFTIVGLFVGNLLSDTYVAHINDLPIYILDLAHMKSVTFAKPLNCKCSMNEKGLESPILEGVTMLNTGLSGKPV